MESLSIQMMLSWFDRHRRPFPWRDTSSAYAVWVSEVMLQQTQASRVISFFLRWMERFPTIEALADGNESEVLKLWEGLGYYSRARALLYGARVIVEKYHGTLPSTKEELVSIPGIGPYTQGAIRSFAFHQKAPAIDANVVRVICRLYDLALKKGSCSSIKEIEAYVEELLPLNKPFIVMEALIELGALICQKKPLCKKCPLNVCCKSFAHGTVLLRPLSCEPKPRIYEKRLVCIFQKQEQVLVVHRTGKAVMSGLWEFPYLPWNEELVASLSSSYSCVERLDTIVHNYTKYCITLYPYCFVVSDSFSWHEGEWVTCQNLLSLPFSSGHKKVLYDVLKIIPKPKNNVMK